VRGEKNSERSEHNPINIKMEPNRPTPPWLHDEPELLALLDAVLDRFNKQPGKARTQRLYFPAEKNLPGLKRQDDEADRLWHFVQELAKLNLCTITQGKRGPYDPEWKSARLAFLPEAETTLREWLQRPSETPAIQTWREAVEAEAAKGAFPGDIAPLLKRRIAIPGMSDAEVVAAFAHIGSVEEPLTLRQLSARHFRGDSKRLDERELLLLALFPDLPLQPRPLLINVYLPSVCNGVLFIENQDSYTLACEGRPQAATDLALVYAAGFRGTAERLRQREEVRLHYAGVGQSRWQAPFEHWWFDQARPPGPLAFWGDLDFAGMAILAGLRQRFGELSAWQPGYRSLLEQLRNQGGHALEAADKQGQTDPGTTGCVFADRELLPAIREYGGIDQELLG
jgi:hypothetical protein